MNFKCSISSFLAACRFLQAGRALAPALAVGTRPVRGHTGHPQQRLCVPLQYLYSCLACPQPELNQSMQRPKYLYPPLPQLANTRPREIARLGACSTPGSPLNLTLAKPSRCHCQVPGALCAACFGVVTSLALSSSTFLPLSPRVAALLLSPSPSPSSTNHCGSSTFTLFFSFFLSSPSPKPSPSASWFACFSLAPLPLSDFTQHAFPLRYAFRRAPFPSLRLRLRAILFLFSLFTTLGVALYCTYVDISDSIVSVLCIYLSFFLLFFFSLRSGDWLCLESSTFF